VSVGGFSGGGFGGWVFCLLLCAVGFWGSATHASRSVLFLPLSCTNDFLRIVILCFADTHDISSFVKRRSVLSEVLPYSLLSDRLVRPSARFQKSKAC